jgi:murein DD-endopeptidase MepM/ murein hydrolase activator NlpD
MRKCLCFLIISIVITQIVVAQNKPAAPVYRNPVDLPIFLSGTFGELRSNHFHSGIDIRTANKTGHKVFAIEDGYVSRIAVSPGGFGKALYIDHPDGHTSVYAHLQQFGAEIASYVKQQQYKSESFEVNLYLEKDVIQVKKGQVVAFSGNSGSSEGPHLHFEIRDTKSQEIMNPLQFGFIVKDKIRPVISRLMLYPIGKQSFANNSNKRSIVGVSGTGINEKPLSPTVIEASGEIAFGITTSDQLDGVPNTNGVYTISLHIDNQEVYKFEADRFSFDETRYINSLIDYDFFKAYNSRVIRTEIDPLNELSMYQKVINKGILNVETGKTYQAEFVVKDYQGNACHLPFTVKGVKPKVVNESKTDTTRTKIIADKSFEFRQNNYFIQFGPGCFYRDQLLSFGSKPGNGFLSQIIRVGQDNIPVHQRYKIGIKPGNEKISKNKLLIVNIEKDKKPTVMGGNWENGFVVASVRNLGDFALMADTTKPQIKPLNFVKGGQVNALKRLQLEIKDELSGISTYRGTLNGQWILMDFDAKNNLLTYDFDDRLKKGTNKLVVKVTDKCENSAVFTTEINY